MRHEIVLSPSIILSPERSIQEGTGRFVLPCFAEGIPLPKVKWESIEAKLQSNVKQVDHYLVIRNVTIADSGYYMCTATNRAGTDIKIIHINVNAKHHLQVAPKITALSEVEVNYYADAKLVCNVTGVPTPRIKWKFSNKTLPSTSSTLILLRATNETAGIYTCIATNDVGTSQADIKLKVTFDKPKIVSPLLTTVCKAGESRNFTCKATAHPTPEISWSFNSFVDHSSVLPKNVQFKNGTVIKLVNMQTSGILSCTATNEFGTDNKSANVIVRHDPDVIG
ncbi:hemicentin-1-like [Mytilus trossulus]|uniref:hemicentin-1-like n=1 Tax=Mytilus trossulus TaxID=6551 RepID=UPI003004F3A7